MQRHTLRLWTIRSLAWQDAWELCTLLTDSVNGTPAKAVQTVSFAPPEGFMDVDRSDKATAAVSGAVPSASDASSGAALADVAASLANVKKVIRSGAADRYQVIDMLTNLLRETLQVSYSGFSHLALKTS